jgi:transcriptional regulator with XRE-family HTH domain
MRFDGAEVKRRREARGLTQGELGAAVGVQGTTICRIERGRRVPHAVTCARVARELRVPLELLLHD